MRVFKILFEFTVSFFQSVFGSVIQIVRLDQGGMSNSMIESAGSMPATIGRLNPANVFFLFSVQGLFL